jgi:hypothetical protein
MVNFRDPVVAGQDYRTHALRVRSYGFQSLMRSDLSTVFLKSLHHTTNGIYLWVRFAASACRPYVVAPLRPAGNSSQRLTTSSISSEGVGPTDGRYGSVVHFFGVHLPSCSLWTYQQLV